MNLVPGIVDRRPPAWTTLRKTGPAVDFGAYVRDRARTDGLVVQPRMGFGDPRAMRAGLLATKAADAATVGTVTLDSYTRLGDHASAEAALREGRPLNGYPIVNHHPDATAGMLDGVHGPDFPVQVRHGSAVPLDIFAALIALGVNASEGGPVSYCLPYGRTPLTQAVENWSRAAYAFASTRRPGAEPHLETFGGCMLGQLCPPSMLVAISVLEAMFFAQHGLASVSVSYAQQTNHQQDIEAVHALRRLCDLLLPGVDWHVVIYAYMGVYPFTESGARGLLAKSAELAVATGSERLIVKTVAEAHRIPTIEENVSALELASAVARGGTGRAFCDPDSPTFAEAHALVDAVLNLDGDVGVALLKAFSLGYLDIPYCLHPDNAGRTRSYIDPASGRLCWAETGSLPFRRRAAAGPRRLVTSSGLITDLNYVRRMYDGEPALTGSEPNRVRPATNADQGVLR